MRCKVTQLLRIDKWQLAKFCAHTILFRLKKLKKTIGVTVLPLRHINFFSRLLLCKLCRQLRHGTVLGADEGTHLDGGLVGLLHGLTIDDRGTETACK